MMDHRKALRWQLHTSPKRKRIVADAESRLDYRRPKTLGRNHRRTHHEATELHQELHLGAAATLGGSIAAVPEVASSAPAAPNERTYTRRPAARHSSLWMLRANSGRISRRRVTPNPFAASSIAVMTTFPTACRWEAWPQAASMSTPTDVRLLHAFQFRSAHARPHAIRISGLGQRRPHLDSLFALPGRH